MRDRRIEVGHQRGVRTTTRLTSATRPATTAAAIWILRLPRTDRQARTVAGSESSAPARRSCCSSAGSVPRHCSSTQPSRAPPSTTTSWSFERRNRLPSRLHDRSALSLSNRVSKVAPERSTSSRVQEATVHWVASTPRRSAPRRPTPWNAPSWISQPSRAAPERSASTNSTESSVEPDRVAPTARVSLAFTPLRSAPRRSAPSRLAPARSTSWRVAPRRSASPRSAPVRSTWERRAPARQAPESCASRKVTDEMSARQKSTPARSAPSRLVRRSRSRMRSWGATPPASSFSDLLEPSVTRGPPGRASAREPSRQP